MDRFQVVQFGSFAYPPPADQDISIKVPTPPSAGQIHTQLHGQDTPGEIDVLPGPAEGSTSARKNAHGVSRALFVM
ncbi:hypothetical protein BT69DRAFT_896605 [Atractiella rhizophila]|nr:hypothetical protein BT69DRAFT_896605 [Atractiella rhizophila]